MKRNLNLRRTKFCSVVVFAFAVAGCHTHVEPEPEPVQVTGPNDLKISAEAMGNLKFATAQSTDFPEVLPIMGKVSPTEDKTTVVPARTAGRIESVMVASGETVTSGQPLCTIFSPDYIAAREEYLQSVKQDNKTAGKDAATSEDFKNLARLSYKKLESLGLTKKDIDALGASAGKDDGTAISNLMVRAQRPGAIITKNAIVGNQVNQGDALFMIADLHQVWFLGDLYPEDLAKVKKDQEVVVDTGLGQDLKGKVSFISPVVDPISRTIKIRALINNPNLALRADMYLQGGLVMGHQKALLIPKDAIFRDENSTYVFKTNGPQNIEGHANGIEAHKVKVAIAGERQGMTAVTTGLSENDQVVSDGALLLNAALSNAGK